VKLRKATDYEQFQWSRYRCDYNDPGLTLRYQFKLKGKVDVERLNYALRMVISDQFQCLLNYFVEKNDVLFVGMNVLPDVVLEHVCEESIWNCQHIISPSGGKLFRFTYFIKKKVFFLNLSFSHLVFDGECYRSFLNLLSGYWSGSFKQQCGNEAVLTEEADTDISSLRFWQDSLKDARLFQPLPFCHKITENLVEYLSVKKMISGMKFSLLSRVLEQHHVTLFQFMVAVTAAVVDRYRDHENVGERIVIAHTVNCRSRAKSYGCYTNVIPLFIDVDCSQGGTQLLENIKRLRETVRQHQTVSTMQLLKMVDPQANRGARLFNLIVNCSDGLVPYETPALKGVEVDWVARPETGGPSDLAINYSCDGQRIYLSFDSSSRCMSQEVLTSLAENFVRMAEFMTRTPDAPLSDCDFSRSLKPAVCGDQNFSILDDHVLTRFVAMAMRHKDDLAVCDEKMALSYQQILNSIHTVNREIARHLDISANGSIGIFLGRSVAVPVAYICALAVQRTFVPMDSLLPDERLQYMGDIADVHILLVDQSTQQRAAVLFPGLALINMDEMIALSEVSHRKLAQISKTIALRPCQSERTAYILFTSGSTGKPKGVAISERNLLNFLCSMTSTLGFRAQERMVALTSVNFDISILELLLPLMCGGCVHILSDTTRISALLLGEAINQCDADMIQATPSTWRILQQSGWSSIRPFTVLCGGEALDTDLAEYLLKQGGPVYNMYGPTEATIWASCHCLTDARRISLGRPVLNSDFYILDSNGNCVAEGMRGELVIAGACVGSGYLNAISESAFVTLANGIKAYKTGDLVRYFSPGDIEYIGRLDSQHKINGYRIDTTDVSHQLKEFLPDASVFTVVRNKPEAHLCSFVWLQKENNFDETEALAWCRRILPHYMVPKAIHRLSAIPLTTNRKANLKLMAEASLDELPLISAASGKPQPRPDKIGRASDIQFIIQQLLAEKLGISVIDINQPLGWFGLNSISYNLLSVEISRHFGIRLHSYEFYQFNSINRIVEVIHQRINPEYAVSTEKSKNYKYTAVNSDSRLAIVGLSVMMPGSREADDFWSVLLEKENCISAAPPDRNLPGYCAGFLTGIKGFDARFFSISPLEAACMDPRQRLLLQASWRTLEDAGYAPSKLAGERIGCYIAATGFDYALLQARTGIKQTPYSLSGYSLSMLANRISAYFDWSGPSFTIDTACSGALTALVKACHDLRASICDAAMVGGINLILDEQINHGLEVGRFISPDWRCATFDKSANGYVRGEGYGCFFIKRYADAVADGDPIHAIIENVAENHGGRANSLTAPNPNAQYRLLLDVYTPELARCVSYIESHGTGTRLGDPIETAVLKRAWNDLVIPECRQPVWLGAVKSNIGHLEAAAGIASIVKVIKSLKHKTLPANLHFKYLNPDIDLTDSPFRILAETTPWRSDAPLMAGISSFGFGGVNAHVVISAPPQERQQVIPLHYDWYLILVSARTPAALQKNIEALLCFLERCYALWTWEDLLHLAYTLSCGREHFRYRQAWLVNGLDNFLAQLRVSLNDVHPLRAEPEEQSVEICPESGSLGEWKTLKRMQSLYLKGGNINWHGLYAGSGARKMHLPTYRFDEREYWFDIDKTKLMIATTGKCE